MSINLQKPPRAKNHSWCSNSRMIAPTHKLQNLALSGFITTNKRSDLFDGFIDDLSGQHLFRHGLRVAHRFALSQLATEIRRQWQPVEEINLLQTWPQTKHDSDVVAGLRPRTAGTDRPRKSKAYIQSKAKRTPNQTLFKTTSTT